MTNEQRAHDLAIASLPYALELKVQNYNNSNEIHLDFYKEYLNLYNILLESFNRDFN